MSGATLLVTDLHLTDRTKDSYRWKLFPWLHDQIEELGVTNLYILGDLTDLKDKHSSLLTNRIVTALYELSKKCKIVLLKGNHDFIQYDSPFFKFTEMFKNITYVNEPTVIGDEIFLPHSKDPLTDWKDIKFDEYRRAYMHQCLLGSLGSQGHAMEHGLDPKFFRKTRCKIYSGDIHVPQTVGCVEYVGTPYPVHIGDHFKPRCIVLVDGEAEDIYFPSIRKLSIRITKPEELKKQKLKKGDQVSIAIKLDPTEFVMWEQYKKECSDYCKEKEVEIQNISLDAQKKEKKKSVLEQKQERNQTPLESLMAYASREKLSEEVVEMGKTFL